MNAVASAVMPPPEDPKAAVDTALSWASRREVFTTEEAMDLLQGVERKAHDREVEVCWPRSWPTLPRRIAATTWSTSAG